MEPILIGGFLIFLVGSIMLGMQVAGLKTGWGHSLLIQAMGFVMMVAFFLSAGEFSWFQVKQAVSSVSGQVAKDMKPVNSSETLQQDQGVVSTSTEAPVESHAVLGDEAPVAVTVVAAPEKAKNEKPIYKCTGQDGKETFSAKPCTGTEPLKAVP